MFEPCAHYAVFVPVRPHPGVMFDSMLSSFSSMTTSMQLAQECLKSEDTGGRHDTAQPFEGVEMFANTIEAGEGHLSDLGVWSRDQID